LSLLKTSAFNQLKLAKYGYTLYNKNDKYIGRSIELYGEFSELEVELFRQICKRDFVVVEVGANIGTHTMALSKIVGDKGRVYAFEPQRVVFQTLCANMALNSITNVEAFQVALFNQKGELLIPEIDYDKEGNFGGIELDRFSDGLKVAQEKADEFLNLKRFDFFKIDVEGMEQGVIEGASKLIEMFKPILYVENDRLEKSDALIQTITKLGYKIYKHNPYLYNPNNFEKNKNNIFGNIVSKNILCIHKDSKIKVEGFEAI